MYTGNNVYPATANAKDEHRGFAVIKTFPEATTAGATLEVDWRIGRAQIYEVSSVNPYSPYILLPFI